MEARNSASPCAKSPTLLAFASARIEIHRAVPETSCVAVLMEGVYQDCLGGLGPGGYARRLCNGANILTFAARRPSGR